MLSSFGLILDDVEPDEPSEIAENREAFRIIRLLPCDLPYGKVAAKMIFHVDIMLDLIYN